MAIDHTPGRAAAAALQFGSTAASEPLFEAMGDEPEASSPTGFLGDIRVAVYNPEIECIVVDASVGATVVEELERSFRLQGPVAFTALPRWFERDSKRIEFGSRAEFDRKWPWGSRRWTLLRRKLVRGSTDLLLQAAAMYVIKVHAKPSDVMDAASFEACIERFYGTEGFRMAGTVVFYLTDLAPWLGAPVEFQNLMSHLSHSNHPRKGQTTKVVFVADQGMFGRAKAVLRLTWKETRIVGPPHGWWRFG